MLDTERKTKPMQEKKKQAIYEELWLTYYNNTLFEKGLITEAQRNKMRIRIHTRGASVR